MVTGSVFNGVLETTLTSDVRYGDHGAPMNTEIWGCDTAEVLIWDEQGRFARNGPGASLFDLAPWNDELDEYDEI